MTQAIKSFILNDKKHREDVIKSSIERHSGILKKLADVIKGGYERCNDFF